MADLIPDRAPPPEAALTAVLAAAERLPEGGWDGLDPAARRRCHDLAVRAADRLSAALAALASGMAADGVELLRDGLPRVDLRIPDGS